MTKLANYTPAQISTIRRTVAKDTNDNEFNLFMGAAQSYGLDPFRRQISAIVFNKDKPEKRNMTIIVGRDGLRTIAQRCGDYRPASEPPVYTYDDNAKSPSNPTGLVSASLKLFKQDKQGAWHPVYGEAHWDEFAPLREKWDTNQDGRRAPTGVFELDKSGQWGKMPRIMLLKCAEAQALRAGWPDEFGGIYGEEEMDSAASQAMRDITPSDAVKQEEQHQRQNMLGNTAVLMSMDGTGHLERIPVGQIADRCREFIKDNDPEAVHL